MKALLIIPICQVYYSLDVAQNTDKAIHDSTYFGPLGNADTEAVITEDDDPDNDDEIQPDSTTNGDANNTNGLRAVHNHGIVDQAYAANAERRPTRAFFQGFFEWLTSNGNALDLFATSFNWMLLDFTFYLLGVNSSSFIPTLFGENNGPTRSPYAILINEARHIMESSSVALLLGGLLAIAVMRFRSAKTAVKHLNSPRKVQIWGFSILTVLFIIVGAMYMKLPTTHANIAIVFFYALANFFFDLGKFLHPPKFDI